MIKNFKIGKFLSLFLISFLLLGFTIKAQHVEDTEIPPDFGSEKGILIVKDVERNSTSKALNENFEKYYTGKYEIVPDNVPLGKKFGDMDKYRYMFETYERTTEPYYVGKTRYQGVLEFTFGIVDRKTDKVYKIIFWTSNFKKTMERYIKKIDAARIKNGG
jgi:hypothetical protein